MTELQRVAYTELHASLVKFGMHGWVPIEGRPGLVGPCPAIHKGVCTCGLQEAIDLLNPETVGI